MKLDNDNILIVFARHPMPGTVKTRLADSTGDKLACEIYSAFVGTTIFRVRNLPGFDLRIDFTPGTIEAQHYFSNTFPGLPLASQEGADLGERMLRSFASAFEDGHSRVCIIGSDSPDIPLSSIETAFDRLESHDAVIGPGDDGGYYLIGLRESVPELFSGVEWGTSRVMEQTMAKAKQLSLKVHSLEPWNDVDNWEDLQYLMAKLKKRIPLAEPLKHLRDALDIMIESI